MLNSPVNPSLALVSPLSGLADINVNSLNLAPEGDGPLQDAHQVFVDSTEVVAATRISQQVGNSTFQLLSFGNPTDQQVPGLKSILSYIQQQNGGQVFSTTKKLYTYITNEAQFVYQKTVGATQTWVNNLAQLASYTQVTGFDARAPRWPRRPSRAPTASSREAPLTAPQETSSRSVGRRRPP